MPPRPIATLPLVLAMAVVQAVPLPAGAAQEWKLERLRIEARPAGRDRAVGTVRFRSHVRDRTITLELARIDGAWRIDDLVYEEGRRLSAFLKQAIAEEQARQPSPPS